MREDNNLIDDVLDDLESDDCLAAPTTVITSEQVRRPRKKERRRRLPKGFPKRSDFPLGVDGDKLFVNAKREFLLRRTLERTKSSHVFQTAESQLAKLQQAKAGRRRSRSVQDNSRIKRSDYLTQEQFEMALRYPQSVYAVPTSRARVWTRADFADMSHDKFLTFVGFHQALEEHPSGFTPDYSPEEQAAQEAVNFESAIKLELEVRHLQLPQVQE